MKNNAKIRISGCISSLFLIILICILVYGYGVPQYLNGFLLTFCIVPAFFLSMLSYGFRRTIRGIYVCRILLFNVRECSFYKEDLCTLRKIIWYLYLSALMQFIFGILRIVDIGVEPGSELSQRIASMISAILYVTIIAEFILRPAASYASSLLVKQEASGSEYQLGE